MSTPGSVGQLQDMASYVLGYRTRICLRHDGATGQLFNSVGKCNVASDSDDQFRWTWIFSHLHAEAGVGRYKNREQNGRTWPKWVWLSWLNS